MSFKTFLAFSIVATLSACSSTKSATEADFGNSQASLIKAQAANPDTLANPSTEAPTGVDPDYANKVIDAMRENVSKPAEVRQPIEIRVGGQSQGGT